MRKTACLVIYPIMVEGYAVLLSCTAVVQASNSMTVLSSGIQSYEPSSLFHHSVLVDFSVSIMMH